MGKIAFVQSETRERFSFMYLSAVLKRAGHEVEVFIMGKDLYIDVIHYNPDIIGFSSSTPSYADDCSHAYFLGKYTNAYIIFGGAHPTFYPDEVITEDYIDAICIGEGYEAILEYAENPESGKVFMPRKKYNINKLPMPDYDLYYEKYPTLRDKPTKQVYIVHGCPWKCGYCWNEAYNKMYKGKAVQCLSVDKAIYEIKKLKKKYGFKWLQFISDNMTIDKEWLRKFIAEYKKEIGIPYLMNVRCNEVNYFTVSCLATAGCDRVDFGIEHGNEYIRNEVLKRNMAEEQIINCGKWFKDFGIRVQTSNIIGLPHDSLDKSIETVKLNQKVKPERAKACLYQPFKGTSLYENYKDQFQNMDTVTGTTIQVGHDGRGNVTKVRLKDEKKLVRLSYLFDFFVQNPILNPFIKIICSFPLDGLYRKWDEYILKKQERKYS